MDNQYNDSREMKDLMEPGEVVLWSAPPDPWSYARPTFMLYIIAVPWTVFTFFWLNTITGGFQLPKPTIAPIPWWLPWVAIGFGLGLLAAGIWMLSAPFWIWQRGKHTLHILTNRRALVIENGYPNKMQSLILQGKVDFRVTNPHEKISDVDVVSGSSKGIVFRAVKTPQKLVDEVAQAIWG